MSWPVEWWEPGDVVLDANGGLWWRSHEASVAEGWPWAYAHSCAPRPDPSRPDGPVVAVPEGAVTEEYPVRPLTLLVRRGKAVLASPATAEETK